MAVGENHLPMTHRNSHCVVQQQSLVLKLKVDTSMDLARILLILLKVTGGVWVQLSVQSFKCNSEAFGFSLKYLKMVFSLLIT